MPAPELQKKVKIFSISEEYDAAIIPLFHATGDFNYRSRWQDGVLAVEEVSHYLPRVGMRCRCIKKDGQANIYSSSYSYSPDRIQFSETDEKDNTTIFYLLESKGAGKTKLSIDFYIKKNIIAQIMFKLTDRKKLEDSWQLSLRNLRDFVKEIKLPG